MSSLPASRRGGRERAAAGLRRAQAAIIAGPAPMSGWKQQWRSEGGDKARDEYRKAYEHGH